MNKRFFNTEGPVNDQKHYCLPPLQRFNLDEINLLIQQEKYFVLHAPRQTGKTSSLLALMTYLNAQGKYDCLYINIEAAQVAREDVKRGMKVVLNELGSGAKYFLHDDWVYDHWPDILERSGEDSAFSQVLTEWTQHNKKPLVLLIDEVDALIGDTLLSLLRQLRTGYTKRPTHFPQSVVLCGVRDVRDYRIHSAQHQEIITGGSAFNIKYRSLRMGDFSQQEVEALLLQQQETGRTITADALQLIWDLTCGQPWLVNALAYEASEKTIGQPRRQNISAAHITQAKDLLIQRRETHIDQLIDKLQEERVRRVIEPLLSGKILADAFRKDDVEYAIDLGLIIRSINGTLQVANKIYQEVIPRELVSNIQAGMSEQTVWYVDDDGCLNMDKLLSAFQAFFREHSEHWVERFQYKEAGPQLLMQAFLQRIVNGDGRIEREYGLGRMRTDLLLFWPYAQGTQIVVIELKLLYKTLEKTITQGVSQTWEYMDKCAAQQGHLVIFNRAQGVSWEDKIFCKVQTFKGKEIKIWGM